MQMEIHSVLVVTKDIKTSTLVKNMLIQPVFDTKIVSDFNEARRLCTERIFNIIIVDFCDGEGTDFSVDISSSTSTILLLVPANLFEQISYKVESFGILTLTTPFDQFYFYNMIKIAIAVQYKVQVLTSQTTKLKEKMEDIRLVNRAKMLLMQNLKMTEEDAHHYLEKEAMNHGKKRTDVAAKIINTYR